MDRGREQKHAKTHGHHPQGKPTPTYLSWKSMLQRCKDQSNKYYGGRGIAVCKRWMSFENFLADMGERPKGKTLDRVNGDKDYGPNNCRWSTYKEQAKNRRLPLI